MDTQLDLHFPSAPAPLQPDPEIERLLTYLDANPGFHTARELSARLDLTDRQIRRAAELANDPPIVSGPGSPGYCHILHCPLEKACHIADTHHSQARRMDAKGIRLRKAAHSIIR